MAIIVLEGCDCSGKSTFAQQLAEKLGYEIVKGSSFEISELGQDGMFEHMSKLLDRENIIIDRFLYSNLVYGSLFDYPMMTPDQYDSLVEKLDEKAFLVYMYAHKDKLAYRMSNRGDDMIKVENIENILALYNTEMFGDFRPTLTLNVDTTSFEHVEKTIDLVARIANNF